MVCVVSKEMSDYKSTLNLPKTAFPMKAALVQREPQRLKQWQEMVAWHEQKAPAFEPLLEKRINKLFKTAEKRRDALKKMVMKQKQSTVI